MAKVGFVSGAGTHGFSFESPEDTHFSVTAVLVEEEDKREVEEGFLLIRQRHFPDGRLFFPEGEIGKVQLLDFLGELQELDFSFHSLLVDKRQLHHKSPLRYEDTFYKFLSGLIYNNLYRTVPQLSVVASEWGSAEFMASFRSYILDNHRVDLFSPAPFTFAAAGEEPLLELASLLGEGLNGFHAGLPGPDVERELAGRCVGVVRWPEGYVPYTVDTDSLQADARDGAVTAAALLRARGPHPRALAAFERLRLRALHRAPLPLPGGGAGARRGGAHRLLGRRLQAALTGRCQNDDLQKGKEGNEVNESCLDKIG